MAKRPRSSTKTKKRLRRVDPKRTLTLEQVAQIKAWATCVLDDETASLHVRRAGAIALVLLGTAARRFELCAFICGDFRSGPDGPIAYFEGGKGNKEAEIPISGETFAAVEHWRAVKKQHGESTAPGAPLFCSKHVKGGAFLARATLNLIWNEILSLAGLPKVAHVGVHVTRHAAGMMFLRATQSLPQTADFMRHSTSRVTEDFYKHVLPSDVRAGVTKAGL